MQVSFPEDQTEKGFVVKNGYSWNAIIKDGKKNGRVIVKDEEGCVSNVLQYENETSYRLNKCILNKGSDKKRQ